jgi:hypothetical protein
LRAGAKFLAVADSIAGRDTDDASRRNASSPPDSARRHGNLIEAVGLGALVAAAVFFVQWHYGFDWGDEGWLWYISKRTALGEVPVRDYFSYDPGRYYWSAAVFRLLGRSGLFEQILANYLFGVIGLIASYVAMARGGMRRPWRIAVLLLLGIALGFPRHKIFEQSLSLTSVAGVSWLLSDPEKRKRWLVFGVATGVAAFIGRNSGLYFAVAGLLAFVLLRLRSRTPDIKLSLVPLLGGIVIGYSPIFFMMLRFRGFTSAFIDSVLLTTKWSWPLRIPFPWHSHASGFYGLDAWQMHAVSWLCIAVALVYVLIIWRGYKAELTGARVLAVGASLAGLPYLHHAFYHADFPHIAQATLPFILAVAAISHNLWTTGQTRSALACFAGMSFLTLSCWLPVEPLVQQLRAEARAPQSLAKIAIEGKDFEVPADQAAVMNVAKAAFESCGAHDGGFMEAPFYPGLYPFLNTRAPFWDTYYLWPRSDELQEKHIQALVDNHTSLLLINPDATFDKQEWLRIGRTYPKLMAYILEHYQRSERKFPDGFEMYYSPQACGKLQ